MAAQFHTKIILIAIGIMYYTWSQAQVGSSTQVPNPHSPDASALGRYVEVPVGHYSGIPSIQVPLYQAVLNGITVPFSLSYHASGLKVKDIPGSVGAGWTLNAGGVINRIVRGFPDDHFPYLSGTADTDHYDSQIRARLKNVNSTGQFNTEYSAGERSRMALSTPGVFSEEEAEYGYLNRVDTEYDIFYFNFNGHVGQFTFDNDNLPLLLSGNDLKIEYFDRKFKVIDAQGITYYFDALEQSMDEGTAIQYYSGGRLYVTSWFVSRIVIPQSNETINFTYKSYHNYELYDQSTSSQYAYSAAFSNTVQKLRYYYTRYGTPAPGAYDACPPYDIQSQFNMVHHYANALFLDEITWSDKKIKFFGGNTRVDLYKYKTDSIHVISGTDILHTIRFDYGYFNPSASDRKHRKLKLDGVRIDDQAYRFSYIEQVHGMGVPPIDARGQDFWGYYNAEDENLMNGGDFASNNYSRDQYTPYYKLYDSYTDPNLPFYIPYRNSTYKNPDDRYAQLGILSAITYPTGGSTHFTYEGNTYKEASFSYPGTIESDPSVQLKFGKQYTKQCRALYLIDHHGMPDWRGTRNFVVHQDQTVSISGMVGMEYITFDQYKDYVLPYYPMAYLHLQRYDDLTGTFVDVEYHEIEPVDAIGEPYDEWEFENVRDNGSIYLSHTRFLTAGRYRIYCEVTGPGMVSQMNINLAFDYKDAGNNYTAGGLRIKKIDFKTDNPSETAFSKTYEYTRDGLSSGVLESPFANIDRSYHFGKWHSYNDPFSSYFYSWQQVCEFFNIYSEPLIPLGNSQGGVIGYSRVTEKREDNSRTVYDFSTGLESGKADEFITNSSLGTIIRLAKDNSWKRGVGKQVDYYDAADNLVKRQLLTYSYQEHTTGNASTSVVMDNVAVGSGGSYYADLAFIRRYPRKALLERDSIVEYTASGVFSTSTSYAYHTGKHYYPIRISQRHSSGEHTITHQRYAQDFTPGMSPTDPFSKGIKMLLDKHVVSPVIERYVERRSSSGGSLLGLSGEVFSFHADRPLLDKVYALEVPAGPVAPYSALATTGSSSSLDSRYQLRGSYPSYDTKGNVSRYLTAEGASTSYLWDYRGQHMVARVTNGMADDFAYSSFEAEEQGNWSYTGSTVPDPSAPTGSRVWDLGTGAVTKTGLQSSRSYVLTYWAKSAAAHNLSGGYADVVGSRDGWTQYRRTLTGVSTAQLSGAVRIDELRLHALDAGMETYTYRPWVGMSSHTDASGRTLYYDYDGYQRLRSVRDREGKLLDSYEYHYSTP